MQDHQMSVLDAAQAVKADVLTSLSRNVADLDVIAAVRTFNAAFNDLPPFAAYRFVPAGARDTHKHVEDHASAAAGKVFLYACMLQAISDSLPSSAFRALPERVQAHQLKQFERIVNNAASITDNCGIDADLFLKDMGLASLRLYAAAAQLIDFRTGIGRASLFHGGLKDVPRRVGIFASIGGFKPFFEIHTHLAYLDEFNEAGWNECYRCCAELYALHPHVLGMVGTSWFYDPALTTISPRLAYLREIPQTGGAYCLFESTDEHWASDATSTSPSRRALYQAGTYQPAAYALIWPRKAQLNWYAADQSNGRAA